MTSPIKKCLLCGPKNLTDYTLLYKTDQCEVHKCMHCGLVYNSRTFGQRQNGEDAMWDGDVELRIYNRGDVKDAFQAEFKKRLKDIKAYLPKGCILDIGCGLGLFLNLARQEGWDTYGVDTCLKTVQLARNELDLKVCHSAVENVDFPDDFFDVATMWDVIEHVPDPLATLGHVNRMLKKGGLFLIKTPNEDSFFKKAAWILHRLSGGLIRFHIKYLYHSSHLYSFSPHTLEMLLELCGFKVIRISTEETDYRFARAQVLAHYSEFHVVKSAEKGAGRCIS